MPKKSTLFITAACILSVGALAVATAAWVQAWMNQPLAAAPPATAVEIHDVAGTVATPGDRALDLTSLDAGGNTQLVWHCGKQLMGTRTVYTGAWTQLQGRALIAPDTRTLRAGELHVTLMAMRGHGEHPAPNALINTVREQGWFLAEPPTAVLRTTKVTARTPEQVAGFDRAVPDWTHALDCTLQLNGIEQPLVVYARLEVGEHSLRVDATFPISRSRFAVQQRSGIAFPAEVDDEVLVEVHIHATPDPLEVIADLNRQIVAQQAATGMLNDQVNTLSMRLDAFENALDNLRRERQRPAPAIATASDPSAVATTPPGPASGAATPHGPAPATAAPAGPSPATATPAGTEAAHLPPRFVDKVDYENRKGDPHFRNLGYAVEFEMVLVPGDPAKGIGPFYVETTETTWKMFRAWSYCEDLADPDYAASLKAALLRPSPCYDDASRGHGFEARAVLGVSRRNALAFCRFVSEQTGRSYRLWTAAEWRYLAEATGGVPEHPLEVAWLADNADQDDFGEPLSMPVGRKPANSLGLYDFWGNVAEWVMDDTQYIRGGSYLTHAKDLTLEWQEKESQAVWNMTYPNFPKSLWWYRDRFDMGFRLVCDPVDLPTGK